MKRLWIVGASSRISRELGLVAAREGWSLLLAGRSPHDVRAAAADIEVRSGRGPVQSATLDLTRHDEICDFCNTHLADAPPDGLFIAAGIMPPESGLAQNPELFARMAHTNYVGVAQLIDLVLPSMPASSGGFISCLTSVAGDRGRASNFRYGSTKAALSTYLEGLQAAAPAGLLIQDVKLGPVDTPMNFGNTRAPFMIAPAEAARAIWRGLRARRTKMYLPKKWFWIMVAIRLLPSKAMRMLRL